jgi:predicted DNA-binding transcriptional regulator AlpA
MLGVSRATLWRWSKTVSGFPVPYQVGPNAVGWDEQEIDEFLTSRRVDRAANDAA